MTRKKSATKREAAGGGGRAGQVPVVGMGASAGGLEALKEFVGQVPAETGMAYVVVTHQHPGHVSLLPELLGRETKMPVREVKDGILLEPDHVYVGPAGENLSSLNGRLHLMGGDVGTVLRLPIDPIFRSLAEDRGDRAICVILSGTGTDGTPGMKAVKGASGMAMVQQPQTAKYAGMPSSAIATDPADYILPPAEMPGRLVAYARGPYLERSADSGGVSSIHGEPMEKIFVLLRGRTGHDFSSYKASTLKRRIGRRMNLHQITEPENYVRYLRENPHEIDMLFRELLIGVTPFFRDPEAWESLGEGAWAELVITFVNIDKVKRAEESGKEALAFSEAIVDTVCEPLVILDGEFRVVTANRSFFRTFKTSLKQMQGEVFFELGAGQWETPELRRLLGEVVREDRSFEDLEVESAFPKLGRRVFLLNGRRLQQGSGLPGMVLLAMEEVTNP